MLYRESIYSYLPQNKKPNNHLYTSPRGKKGGGRVLTFVHLIGMASLQVSVRCQENMQFLYSPLQKKKK